MERPSPRVAAITLALPAAAAAAAAVRYQFALGVTVCLVVAVALAPVWLGVVREYRFVRTLLALAVVAAVWGATASLVQTERPFGLTLLANQTGQLLSLVGGAGLLLWARSAIGTGWTVTAFGAGSLIDELLSGVHPDNAWKYSLAMPVALLALGITMQMRSRVAPLVVLGVLIATSAASDSRSMTSFLLLAAAALLWQAFAPLPGARPKPWQTVVWLTVTSLAVYSLMQALILDGVLGEAAAQRSEAQIDRSGSLIVGGRPELGAASALIAAQPLGYGSGVRPVSSDVWIAKDGMSALGYDPNNGYVESFMFGGHYEVHSVIGDLWIWFGPVGAALAVLIVVIGIAGTASRISTRTASAVLVLLMLLGAWDALFSPMLSSYDTLALLFAITAPPAVARAAGGAAAMLNRASPSSRRDGAPASGPSTPS